MSEIITFLDQLGLQKYDALIKQFIRNEDATSFKAVGIDGYTLKFYRSDPITEGLVAAYEIQLPETDLSHVMELVQGATAGHIATLNESGQVVDSGKKVSDFATAEQGLKADSAVQTITTGDSNGTIKVDNQEVAVAGLGSAAYKNVDAFDVKGAADAVLGTSTDDETQKTVYGALKAASNAQTTANNAQTGVNEIKSTIGTVAEGKTVVEMISDAQEAATYDDTSIRADITANAKAIESEAERAKGVEGDLTNLNTSAKNNLVSAINEVKNAVEVGGTAAAITVDTSTTTTGYLKSYTIKQGENVISTIDIPKDLVVQSGSVVTNPEGLDEGTYIKLIIANSDEPLYINVGKLVDIYVAKSNATQVQVVVDNSTREISAVIVAESIGTTELSNDAVTTAKIADKNITKEKLSDDIIASLTKADSAVQSISSGTANGTIAVDGQDVSVTGLGSAAFTNANAYDVAGAASNVLGSVDDDSSANTVYGAKKAASEAHAAANNAQSSANKAQEDLNTLNDYVGTFVPVKDETTVVGYVDAKIKSLQDSTSTASTALSERVKSTEDAIAAINDESTGILAQAKSDATTKSNQALADAKTYTDNLANGQVATNTSAISVLTSKMSTAETNISTNAQNITDLQNSLNAIQRIPDSAIEALFATSETA